MTLADFPLTSSMGSGFFFWGIMELPVDTLSEGVMKPNSSVAHRTHSSASLDKWMAVMELEESSSSRKSRSDTPSTLREWGEESVDWKEFGLMASTWPEVVNSPVSEGGSEPQLLCCEVPVNGQSCPGQCTAAKWREVESGLAVPQPSNISLKLKGKREKYVSEFGQELGKGRNSRIELECSKF